MSNFDPNAILRGAQLTIVGAHRALMNPALFKHEHYKQAVLAVAIGVLIEAILQLPILLARVGLWSAALFVNLETVTWDDIIVDTIDFLQHSVLQLPFFMMNLMKFLTPALDDMFMEGLRWVDQTYTEKHAAEDPTTLRQMYYPNLRQYSSDSEPVTKSRKRTPWDGLSHFLIRYGRRAGISLTMYLLSETPYIGKLVVPVFSFYTFDKAVGPKPAIAIFASGLILPKRYLIRFLQAYFASRSMMRELLEPYFSRVSFTSEQKRAWFLDREGVLFGFGVGFFLLVKIPLVGVLIYGIAEASTAYLITKITDPPPPPAQKEAFVESQTTWRNKKDFMRLPLAGLDALNVRVEKGDPGSGFKEMGGKKFT